MWRAEAWVAVMLIASIAIVGTALLGCQVPLR
jgi:hypothetical protein